MEAGFIKFDPSTEFTIIQEIEFEEDVQRPESMRFFTLSEQLVDYFDKSLPKKSKISKFEYDKISHEVDRLQEIYERTIDATQTDYVLKVKNKQINVSWVKPIYTEVKTVPFSYSASWIPLYQPSVRSIPNYFPRMMVALPKPYKSVGDSGVTFTSGGVLVNDDGKNEIRTLGLWNRTKGVVHEDGHFSVVKVPVLNTADEVKTKGFYIDKRSVDIPNPLSNHPFLSSNESNHFLTIEPLENVFPNPEAVMTHGVPKTSDPYVEGKKFLDVYDMSLADIHWNLWKENFAPVETIQTTPPAISVKFPDVEENKPAKNVQDMYVQPWFDGVEPRFWLSKQEDNGAIVKKMIHSTASSAGLLAPSVVGDRAEVVLTQSNPDECFRIETFETFMSSGIYRSPPWSAVNTAVDKHKPLPSGFCIPVAQIIEERTNSLSIGKVAWKETTQTDMLKEHSELLKFFQYESAKPKLSEYEKHVGKPMSDVRKKIVAILGDEDRFPIDKRDDIKKIIREFSATNDIYYDGTESFLVCEHTLAELGGELEEDRLAYYEKWTFIDEGNRSCRRCGQIINSDVFAAQDDFDEDGNVIISHEVLATPQDTHSAVFANSLSNLKSIFLLEKTGESILYLLLSLIQVLPEKEQVFPILNYIRDVTAVLQKKKIDKITKDRIEGILGVVGVVILLQTHNPFLIPRRSFGSRIFKLTGFPRDTSEASDSPVLDNVISVLKTTFESSPNTFKGPATALLRAILSKPKDVRKESIGFLKNASDTIKVPGESKSLFELARERYEAPVETPILNQVVITSFPVKKTKYEYSDQISNEQKTECVISASTSYLSGRLPPNVVQEKMTFLSTDVSKSARKVEYHPLKIETVWFSDEEIRRRIDKGYPKKIKIDKFDAFLRSDADAIALLALLSHIIDILSKSKYPIEELVKYRKMCVCLRTKVDKSILRDAAKGLVYELLHDIDKSKKTAFLTDLKEAVKRDLVFAMILLTKEDATKQDSDLRSREREVFKHRMRQMNDTEREATKMLLDIGIAPYIITNEDREIFAREYNLPDPEVEYEKEQQEADIDRPEEGFNAQRSEEDGLAAIVNGIEQQVDYGDYGDAPERFSREYENALASNQDEGYGT